jgi:hydroxypyruvate isomerase
MQRRHFLQQGLIAGAGTFLSTSAWASASTQRRETSAEKPFQLNYAFHDGMFRNSAGADFVDQIKWAHGMGFRAIEDNGMMGRNEAQQKRIGETLASLDMTMGVFVVDKGGNGANTLAAGKKEYIDIFLAGCRRAVEVAKRTNAKWMTVVPGDYSRNLPLGLQTSNVVEALRRGAEILEPHNLVMVLEPLSDTPDLFLRYSDQTYLICKAVNSPACKILFDMYHMQRNEGNLIDNMDKCWDEIAYLQIGDNPGRNEPTTGEINYKNIFKHVHQKGFKGVLGMEHGNAKRGKEGEQALIRAYRESDSF